MNIKLCFHLFCNLAFFTDHKIISLETPEGLLIAGSSVFTHAKLPFKNIQIKKKPRLYV